MSSDERGSASDPPAADVDLVTRRSDARARTREPFAASFIGLPAQQPSDRRVGFRQAMAALARTASEEGPGPLEGIRPEALVKGVAVALESGLFDDLDWLDAGTAGCAIYQLAAALPVGAEQRELGRRVLSRLLAGNATTFAMMACLMARAGGKGLASPPVFARIALLCELPLAAGVPDGPLALAIASRRQLAREYVVSRSTRSLSERRLSARLLERAAREAVQRAAQGDRSALRLIGPDGILEPVWARLFADREPLVWRHVAVARGLLLPFSEPGCAGLEAELSAELTPTEWRRAAAAIGGVAVSKPDLAVRLATRAFRDGLIERDPGAVAPFVWGLARAAESEPDAAAELFRLAETGPAQDLAEAAVYLRRELGEGALVSRAIPGILERLTAAPGGAPLSVHGGRAPPSRTFSGSHALSLPAHERDDGLAALRAELIMTLEGTSDGREVLAQQLEAALSAFATDGARAAYEIGLRLFDSAQTAVAALASMGSDARTGEPTDAAAARDARRASFAAIRDIDSVLLESSVLSSLLHLDNRPERVRASEEILERMRDAVFGYIMGEEVTGAPRDQRGEHLVLHFARLKGLLHLVDSDSPSRGDEAIGDAPLNRWRTAVRDLSARFATGASAPLRRALMATFARSLDALTRAGACDASDAVLVAASVFHTARDLETLGEASMDPDFRSITSKLVQVVRALPANPAGPVFAGAAAEPGDSALPLVQRSHLGEAALSAFLALTDALAEVGTSRADALRSVLVRVHHAAVTMARATSLRDLGSGSEADACIALENAAFSLAQIHTGSRARTAVDASDPPPAPVHARALSTLLSRATAGGADAAPESLRGDAVEDAARVVAAALPGPFGSFVVAAAKSISMLPAEEALAGSERAADLRLQEPVAAELPAWLPPRRGLGAFYVERPLGSGGVGSVFVVTRMEDKADPTAERFALKVPDYNANAARHLSEAQFLAHFRAEASALMGLPPHPSLARFVSFDLASRPKPILVMELVEGPNLELLIDTQRLDLSRALRALEQVIEGLAAMHESGVGHLDLKPANIVLRGGDTAVLVDFGLAGKNIRLGCGSAPYSPPEVWGAALPDAKVTPMAADIYSFACLAFEALTGELLMEGENEVQMVSSHVAHDGLPPRLRDLTRDPRFVPLGELLFAALRRLPQNRLSVGELRSKWEQCAARLAKLDLSWPLPLPS